MAGLLVMEGGLVGVVGALLDAFRCQRVVFVDRIIVAERAIAAEHAVENSLPVDRIFQREPQVVVVEGGRVAMHEEAVEALARGLQDLDAGRTLQKRHGLRIDAVDEMHLPGGKCRNAGRVVVHDDDLDAVDIAAVRTPVGGVLLEGCPDAGLIACKLVGPGADRRGGVVAAAPGWMMR